MIVLRLYLYVIIFIFEYIINVFHVNYFKKKTDYFRGTKVWGPLDKRSNILKQLIIDNLIDRLIDRLIYIK
jgi:hypothetical protein